MINLEELDPKTWIVDNQEKIMGFYLKIPISSTLVVSPLREDHKPTCSFYYGKTGRLYFHDFGIEKSYDVFEVVKTLFNLSFPQAINRIMSDKDKFHDVVSSLKKKEGMFRLVLGEDEARYFDRYYISRETLYRFNVHSIKSFFLNEKQLGKATLLNPIYAYKFQSGRFKIYQPKATESRNKWSGNSNAEDVGGLPQLPYRGKLLIITSSLKDVMVLSELGYNAVCFNGEGYGTSNSDASKFVGNVIESLKRRFEYIMFFMDNDKAGKQYSTKLTNKYGIQHGLLPKGPKDISDFIQKNGFYKTHRTFKKILSKALRNAKSNSTIPFIHVPY